MIAPPRPPSHDELEALIKEARARQVRRRLLGTAAIAIAAGLGLGVYVLAGSVGNQSAAPGSARAGVRPCRAAQLTTSAEAGAGDGAGVTGASIQLVDASSHACVLPTGLPGVTFTLRGKTAQAEERTMGPPYTAFGARAGSVLAPGRKVMYMLEWSGACPNPAAAPTSGKAVVILRFRNGPRFTMPEGRPENVPILPGCGEEVEPPPTVSVTPLLLAPA